MNQLENLCCRAVVCAVLWKAGHWFSLCVGAAASTQPSWAVASGEDLSWLTKGPDVQ